MKYIAFTVLALVLLAAIGGIVLRANMPSARLTVHAVRPMGTNAYLSQDFETHPWPVWEVAITNSGRARATWRMSIMAKDTESGPAGSVNLGSMRPYGTLPSGQWTNVYAPMPSDSVTAWQPGVEYKTPMSPLERTLSSWLAPVPKLRVLLPNYGEHSVYGTWHSGTNLLTAH